jgi:hypothetical protein
MYSLTKLNLQYLYNENFLLIQAFVTYQNIGFLHQPELTLL